MFYITNISNPYYFNEPASPFMRAIIDLHDYVFMFLVGVLVFVFYIVAVILRNNSIMGLDQLKTYNVFQNFAHFFYYKLLSKYFDLFLSNKHKIYLIAVEKLNKRAIKPVKYEESNFYFNLSRFLASVKDSYKNVLVNGGSLNYLINSEETSSSKIIALLGYFFLVPFIFVWKYFVRFGSTFTQFFIFSRFKRYYEKVYERVDTNSLFYLSKLLYKTQLRRASVVSYKFTHHDTLETIWTLVPSMILLLIAIPSLLVLYALDEIGTPAMTVKAIGHQWYWSYEITTTTIDEYGKEETLTKSFDSYMVPTAELEFGAHRNLQVDNVLRLPINTHIRLIVTSMDVLHSWAMPAFGVKIDCVPGRLNQTGMYIDRYGTFYGQCSEICGTNHGFMPIVIEVIPGPNWIEMLPTYEILLMIGAIERDDTQPYGYKINL
jgi:cytochrome c oxidase subunit 2